MTVPHGDRTVSRNPCERERAAHRGHASQSRVPHNVRLKRNERQGQRLFAGAGSQRIDLDDLSIPGCKQEAPPQVNEMGILQQVVFSDSLRHRREDIDTCLWRHLDAFKVPIMQKCGY